MGLPVLPAFSLCTCCRHYPGAASECMSLLTSPDVSAFPERVVGSACAMSFSRLARRSLTLRPAHSPSHLVTFYIEGFSHFVTSMTASIASGWSKSCRVGLSPTGKRRLSPAHTQSERTTSQCTAICQNKTFQIQQIYNLVAIMWRIHLAV
jgi:hypothetical protein